MKNKKKLLIIIIIFLIPIITIGVISELSKYHTYTVKITNIGADNYITVENESDLRLYKLYENIENEENAYGHKITTENGVYVTAKYRVYAQNVKIKNNKGKKISVYDLKIGDTLYIVTKDGAHIDLATTPDTLYNVKLIKVLEK